MRSPLYLYRRNSYIIRGKSKFRQSFVHQLLPFPVSVAFLLLRAAFSSSSPATSIGQSGAAGMTAPATLALASTGVLSKHCHLIVCQSLGDWAPQRRRGSRESVLRPHRVPLHLFAWRLRYDTALPESAGEDEAWVFGNAGVLKSPEDK